MQTYFSDLSEDAQWRRHMDEMDARRDQPSWSATTRCLKCGHGIDISKHSGKVLHFDPGTETLHVCKPTYRELMAKVHRDLRREELRNEKPGKGHKVSLLFGKRRPKA